MTTQLNNNVFDQLTAGRDYIRQRAALAGMMVHLPEQSFGLGGRASYPAENGERTRGAALARSSSHLLTKSAAMLLEGQCKEWLPASKHPAGQKEPPPARSAAVENREITYRVALSLMENEQISLARKTLAGLPVGQLSDPMIIKLRDMLAVPVTKTSQKRDTDRTLDYQWIRDHAQNYRGQWVALENGKLITAAASLRELLDYVKHLEHRPLLHQIT